MKKTYPTSRKHREWWKHMRWKKRYLNRSTRKVYKMAIRGYRERPYVGELV